MTKKIGTRKSYKQRGKKKLPEGGDFMDTNPAKRFLRNFKKKKTSGSAG